MHSDRPEQHRCGQAHAHELYAQVARRDIPQHARNNAPALEGPPVRAHRLFAARTAGDVVVGFGSQDRLGFFLERRDRDWHRGLLPHQPAHVDLNLSVETVRSRSPFGLVHRIPLSQLVGRTRIRGNIQLTRRSYNPTAGAAHPRNSVATDLRVRLRRATEVIGQLSFVGRQLTGRLRDGIHNACGLADSGGQAYVIGRTGSQ